MRNRIWLWIMNKMLDGLIKMIPYLDTKKQIDLMNKFNEMLEKLKDIKDPKVREFYMRLLGIQLGLFVAITQKLSKAE